MKVLIGLLVVLFCVCVGFVSGGGHLKILWQPHEFLMIFGVGLGAYIIANTKETLKRAPNYIMLSFSGEKYRKADYLDLLSVLYNIFKKMKIEGALILDKHLDDPQTSNFFKSFTLFFKNKREMFFLCDYLRMIVMGADQIKNLNELMDDEIRNIASEKHRINESISNMADAMPAMGIIAAVLGVIHSMSAIDQPPSVIGELISIALVGTFLGIFLSYGVFGPIANNIKIMIEKDLFYIKCIQISLISFLKGSPPLIAVESGRKILIDPYRPSFAELEEYINKKDEKEGGDK